jgi:cytochrome c oxidase assembly protein subunit 15
MTTDATVTHGVLKGQRAVKIWLGACSGLVFAMVVVGGVTRLTESGLSMVKWQPIRGTIPPRSHEEWVSEFENYKNYPEYRMYNTLAHFWIFFFSLLMSSSVYNRLNPNMTLEGFKRIYWWEWTHRELGRTIGVAFALPFFYFLSKGYIQGTMKYKLWAVLVGIGLQGALGWYMVKSGLEENEVNQNHPRVGHFYFLLFGVISRQTKCK